MSAKSAAILEKVSQDRRRGDFRKAVKRLSEAIEKIPNDELLFEAAIEVSLEAGEPMSAIEFFKIAQRGLGSKAGDLWSFAAEKVKAFNDPVMCKFLVEQAVKKRDMVAAETVLENIRDHTATELLTRTRTKMQTLSAAMGTGMAFRGEMVVNTLVEALLCFRSKMFPEGVKSLLKVLEQKPVEHESLTTFFEHVEKKYPKKGHISYGLGCCFLAAESHRKAASKIMQGVTLTPSLAQEAASKLESLKGKPNITDDDVDISVARLAILTGSEHEASERLSEVMERSAASAGRILELLAPHVEEVDESLLFHYLYIEAALVADKNEQALAQIKTIYKDRRQRTDLLSWLDTKAQERFLPIDILMLHGEMTLDQGMYEHAVDILRSVHSQAPAEGTAIETMLAPHRAEPTVKDFYDSLGGQEQEQEQEKPAGDGFDIEHFGNREFKFDAKPTPEPAQPSIEKPVLEQSPTLGDRPSFRGVELDLGAPASAQETQPVIAGGLDEDTGYQFHDPFKTTEDVGAKPDDSPQDPIELEPVTTVEQDNKPEEDIDARPGDVSDESFEQDDETIADMDDEFETPAVILLGTDDPVPAMARDERPVEPAPVIEPTPVVEPPETVKAAPKPEPAPRAKSTPKMQPAPQAPQQLSAEENFENGLMAFQRGQLKNPKTLEFIAYALKMGKLGDAKTLLSFKPANLAEEIKRKYYLADYYLCEDQALSALVILKTVNPKSLGTEERRSFLLKIAYCYQTLNRFEAAHSTYLRIMSDDPDFSAVEELAKANYRKYLNEISGGAAVLEKVTTVNATSPKTGGTER